MPRRRNTILFSWVAALVALSLVDGRQHGFLSPRPARSSTEITPFIIYDIAYAGGTKSTRRQTLDLYLPLAREPKPPLLIFVHGGFWTSSDDKTRIGASLASALRADGVAVALVRYRLAPTHRHPAAAQDLASAVAYLMQAADRHGYDRDRIFLAGHAAGAHLASLVALDPTYLRAHRIETRSLSGVVALSGIFDLAGTMRGADAQKQAIEQAFGRNPAVLGAASPVTHASSNAPDFLILSAGADLHGFQLGARQFAIALRNAGHRAVEQLLIASRDHLSIARLGGAKDPVRALLLAFLKVRPLPRELAAWLNARRQWLTPPFSTLPFWENDELVRSYPVDERFIRSLLFIYRSRREELLEWPLKRFYAIDLFSYLDSLAPERAGQGNYLVITNIRNEKQFWTKEQIRPYKPVIVIGLDDEKNLFRLVVFYHMLRQHSWEPEALSPPLALALGGFVYFLQQPPSELQSQSWHYGLTVDSLRLWAENPLASLKDVPKEVYEALTFRNGCIYCHTFRDVGSRSHHVLASSGAPHGGFALPLEAYPAETWKAFMFEQEEVAKKMGAMPNIVSDDARQALYDLVVENRRDIQTPRE